MGHIFRYPSTFGILSQFDVLHISKVTGPWFWNIMAEEVWRTPTSTVFCKKGKGLGRLIWTSGLWEGCRLVRCFCIVGVFCICLLQPNVAFVSHFEQTESQMMFIPSDGLFKGIKFAM